MPITLSDYCCLETTVSSFLVIRTRADSLVSTKEPKEGKGEGRKERKKKELWENKYNLGGHKWYIQGSNTYGCHVK